MAVISRLNALLRHRHVALVLSCYATGSVDPSYEDLTALLASSGHSSAQDWGTSAPAPPLADPAAPPIQLPAQTVSLSHDVQESLHRGSPEDHLNAQSQAKPGLPEAAAADSAADASSSKVQRQASPSRAHLRSDRTSTSSSLSQESSQSAATPSRLLQSPGLSEPSSSVSAEDISMQELAAHAGMSPESASDSDNISLHPSSSSNEDSEGNVEDFSTAQGSAALDQSVLAVDTDAVLEQRASLEGPSTDLERQRAGCERQREGSQKRLAATGTDASSAQVSSWPV